VGATFVVNTTADGTDGVCATTAGGGTLRDAIKAANALRRGHHITLPAGTYNPTVTGTNEDSVPPATSDIVLPVTINGRARRRRSSTARMPTASSTSSTAATSRSMT
jgi:CSLREA domain-containing protein